MQLWLVEGHGATSEEVAPKDAARSAMEELSGSLIGIAMVLSGAVLVPTSSSQVLPRRILPAICLEPSRSSAVGLSAFQRLTLSPALAADSYGQRRKARATRKEFFACQSIFGSGRTEIYLRLSGCE